jgi:hypothetical protein
MSMRRAAAGNAYSPPRDRAEVILRNEAVEKAYFQTKRDI